MAQRGQTIPAIAGAALTARTIVKLSASATVITCAAATDQPIGVAEFDTPIGLPVGVIVDGVAKVTAGAAFPAGARLTADASGRAVAAAPAAGTNNGIIGIAYQAAGALGDQVDVLIAPSVFQG